MAYRCEIAWRDLAEVFGPWQTVWTWHRRMAADGAWDEVLAALIAQADAAGALDWSLALAPNVTSVSPAGEGSCEPGK
jgi:transposase